MSRYCKHGIDPMNCAAEECQPPAKEKAERPLGAAACSPWPPLNDVINGLRTLAAQERKAQSLLTGPRDAPEEFERWYVAEILEAAAQIIEENTDSQTNK